MINNAAVKSDIESILFGPIPDVYTKLEMVIIANGRRLVVPKVLTRHIVRDYGGQFGDEHYVTFQLGMTTYSDYVYPYMDSLKVELGRTRLGVNGEVLSGEQKLSILYDAFLIEPININMMKTNRGQSNKVAMENSALVSFDVQLIECELNALRMVEVSGTYRSATVSSIIRSALSTNPKDIMPQGTTSQVLSRFKGVHMVQANNQQSYTSVIVPTGTLLKDLPLHLHKDKGMYGGGIGRYYQDGLWHVYPLYDYTRFTRETSRLVIYSVPPDEMLTPERSFMIKGNDVHIIATGGTSIIDASETVAQNEGTGVRITRASSLVDGMVTSSGNKAQTNQDATNKAFAVQSKPTGLNLAKRSTRGLTDNPYEDASRLTKALGFTAIVNWENAKPKYLYPGQPVRFFYEEEDIVKEAYGTLLGTRIDEGPSTGLFNDVLYRTTVKLIIHVKKI